jgi:two-component system response regulator MtrA
MGGGVAMMDRVLLIEDDAELGAQIVEELRHGGLPTIWCRVGEPLTADVAAGIGLVILDLMLPGTYGMDILKNLRAFSELPVLVLSARNDSSTKVRAFKLGADDYITKPFWPEELLERVRARLRRPKMRGEGTLAIGPIHVDVFKREATASGNELNLTRVEFDLLAALMRRADAAVARSWLLENVLDPERDATDRTLDVHVSRLRRKLGDPALIETVWGIGYKFKSGGGR